MNDVQSSNALELRRDKKTGSSGGAWKWAAAAAVLGGAALFNRSRAKRAERENPPQGKFLTIDGVNLHYLEHGQGEPIILLHGNGTMIEDWIVSGVFDALAADYRVIAFDRPGFGHSERPRSRIWTPAAQAALIAGAMSELKAGGAVVVGHSFGTLVAAELALGHRSLVSRLVLLGGYFFPSARADVLFASPPAIPVVGDVMRYTVSPLLGAALVPVVNKQVFSPAPVPERWMEEFPIEMTLRPSQIRAAAAEAGLMVPAAVSLAPRLPELDLPMTIIAGDGDKLVTMEDQSARLHEALPQSRFIPVEGSGHMVHHSATNEVVAAIRAV